MRKKRIVLYIILSVVIPIILTVFSFLKSVDILDFTQYSTKDASKTTGEIVAGTVIHQEFQRLYKEMDGIRLQFANYSNRPNNGHINIKVSDDKAEIAMVHLDVSTIRDGEFVEIPFKKKKGILEVRFH